ncbi:helix-turn-helix transcriptional regulator [[Flexibacter] sp. ATCC 35208]|uniref:helix-turn-helix transcriptional regulator n=1 Tax=[Flexibacter] sp. ATCC 35208 TaxID=1936242 RepID=UPI0015C31314|nr:helix-turn-helix transcriptional regulator [[Flexibacter] sp. ATCC 35208]
MAKPLHQPQAFAWTNHFLTEKKPCRCFVKSDDRYIIFYYVLKGRMEYRNTTEQYVAVETNMNMISAINHELIIKENSEIFFLFIPSEILECYKQTFPIITSLLIREQNDLTKLIDCDIKDDGRVRQLVGKQIRNGDIEINSDPNIMEQLLLAALIQLFSLSEQNGFMHYEPAIHAVRSTILNHIYERKPPSLEKLSRMAGLNTRKLESVFKQYNNTTMLEFYQVARMEAIYRSLFDYRKSLQDIAATFNYEDYPTFSAAVKRRWGKSPRELRNSLPVMSKLRL